MSSYDEQLRTLQAQCARKKKLEAAVAELHMQQDTYTARAQELRHIFQEEQADVDRLEGQSLTALFYQAIGKMEEKLSQEKQEAYAAQVKYHAAARELEGIQADLRRCQAELDSLGDCESRYAAMLQEKIQAVKTSGGSAAEQILRLEERIAYLESQGRELEEACIAGRDAAAVAEQIAQSLDSAAGWGTWDLVGGGFLSDIIKHGHLDQAQADMEALQSQLRRFKTELADVTINADFQVSIDGFLRVADYFFDGIFADWMVLDRIHQSQAQIQNTTEEIYRVLDYLQTLMEQTAAEQVDLRNEMERLVSSIPL